MLQRHGFILVSQRGSHQKWRDSDTGKQVVVPYHKGKQLPLGTLRSIIEGSGIAEEEFYG
ncbi:MAG: type II toxin-antitoxin system HicA family toxin [Chloroflexi bacterium]|nr:type II toxin-antitoxin system HicA family toxin [Chloroflexota bacterium]